jgi:anthranilate phosphoribosyltransferase
MAGALARLGVDRALVVSSEDGLDEMSTSAPTHVVEVNGTAIERYMVTPQDVGIATTTSEEVAGGTPDANARTTRAILDGDPGAPREIALLNAGAAIYAGGAAGSLREGVEAAREAVDSGAARQTLDSYVDLSWELATA